MPRHVAIIMDGNGRWAALRGLSRIQGHRRGKDSVREVVETAREIGIEWLTLYAVSSENWARPRREIDALMRLLRRYLRTEVAKMMRHGIRLRAIGNLRKLPAEVLQEMRAVEQKTKDNDGMTVQLAVSYGAREEIEHARAGVESDDADVGARHEFGFQVALAQVVRDRHQHPAQPGGEIAGGRIDAARPRHGAHEHRWTRSAKIRQCTDPRDPTTSGGHGRKNVSIVSNA